jgi:hypothetical protein
MLDEKNLIANESVGTFRWNQDQVFPKMPKFNPEMRELLDYKPGWQTYINTRFETAAVGNEIKVEPY